MNESMVSRVNLTPLLDVIFLLLFVFIGGLATREATRERERSALAERQAALQQQLAAAQVEAQTQATALRERAAELAAQAERERGLRAQLESSQKALRTQAERLKLAGRELTALREQLAKTTAAMKQPYRTLAAAQHLMRQFKVYELRLQARGWMELRAPGAAPVRRRINEPALEELLGQARGKASVVLLFIEPAAIYKDVLAVKKKLEAGFAFQEFRLPVDREDDD